MDENSGIFFQTFLDKNTRIDIIFCLDTSSGIVYFILMVTDFWKKIPELQLFKLLTTTTTTTTTNTTKLLLLLNYYLLKYYYYY